MTATADYSELLVQLGGRDPRMVVLDAGLATSMQTQSFRDAYPERYLNLGIAEANVIGFSSGLARRGYRPWVHSFANFLARRAHDQIAISIALPGLPVTLVGGSCGVFDGRNGPSHFGGDDTAAFMALPGFSVFEPADLLDTSATLEWASSGAGPVYVRLRRHGMPAATGRCVNPREATRTIVHNARPAVTIVCIGMMLDETLTASHILSDAAIAHDLLHVLRLKPLDVEPILQSARASGRVVLVENHVPSGGGADAVHRVLGLEGVACTTLSLPDEILPVGDPKWLLGRCGLDAKSLADRIEAFLREACRAAL
jgi:transketolase